MRIFLAFFISVLLYTLPAFALDLGGEVRLTDGDTLVIDGQIIRLEGIDAFENGQNCTRNGKSFNCGAAAENALRDLVDGPVQCSGDEFDDYGRLLARCSVNDLDLGEELVRRGYALAYRRYSDAYISVEQEAERAGSGVWAGAFVAPWTYRNARWTAGGESAPDPKCPIKGNINRKGDRIYHAPWSRSYDRTKINTAKGERWFCSENEAIDAGWRAPFR